MPSARRFSHGSAAWFFGLASTVLLVAIWGRAVVVDTGELAESLSPLAGSDAVVNRFSAWLVEELTEEGLDPITAESAAEHVLDDPAVSTASAGLLGEMVEAAASPDPAGTTVDARSIIHPAVPDITVRLNELGVPVSEAQIDRGERPRSFGRSSAGDRPLCRAGLGDRVEVGHCRNPGPHRDAGHRLGFRCDLERSIEGDAQSLHPLLARSSVLCGVSPDWWIGARSRWRSGPGRGDARAAGNFQVVDPAGLGIGCGGRGDGVLGVQASSGQTGGRVPDAKRSSHTATRLTPTPISTRLTTRCGIGPTLPARPNMAQAHPAMARATISGISG